MLPVLAYSFVLLARGIMRQGPMSAKEVFARYQPAVVQIETNFHEGQDKVTLAGTGFFFLRDDLVATAFHVVDKAETITIKDSEGNTYAAKALIWDKKADTALIGLAKHSKRPFFTRQAFDKVAVGETVFTIGNTLGLFPDTISQGIVSGKRDSDSVHYVQITAATSHGNSGGPVIDDQGHAIGFVEGSVEEGQNVNLAISTDESAKLADGDRTWTDVSDYLDGNKKDNVNAPAAAPSEAKPVHGKNIAADPILTSPAAAGEADTMAFSPDGKVSAAAAKNRLFVFSEDKLAKDLYFDADICGVAIPDAKRLLVCFVDGTYRVVDPASGKTTSTHRIGMPAVEPKLSPDGKTLYFCVVSSAKGGLAASLMALDLESGELRTLSDNIGIGHQLDVRRDGAYLVGIGSTTLKKQPYDMLNVIVSSGRKMTTVYRHHVSAKADASLYHMITAAFSPDGRVVALSSMGNDALGTLFAYVELIDIYAGKPKRDIDLDAPVWSLSFSPDGKYLWLEQPGTVACLNLETGEPEFRIRSSEAKDGRRTFAISPKGDRLLVSAGKTVQLYRIGPAQG
ncbi:MAG TPA: trypsin-like peptidase domain-containing protein [Fimbriimonadaceae bacterium]|nr:trypsin-like peptidase domain-containing protein [Fimbriimonadaceae bacterium]